MSDKPTWEDYYRVLKGRAEGKIPYNPSGYYIVTRQAKEDKKEPSVCVKQVTPVAAAVERAKSETKTSIKGTPARKKSKSVKKIKHSYSAFETWQAQSRKR